MGLVNSFESKNTISNHNSLSWLDWNFDFARIQIVDFGHHFTKINAQSTNIHPEPVLRDAHRDFESWNLEFRERNWTDTNAYIFDTLVGYF